MTMSAQRFLVLGAVLGLLSLVSVEATSHSLLWTVPQGNNNETLTMNVMMGGQIRPGDNLQFNFSTGSHNVTQVEKENYYSCNTSNPIQEWTEGNSVVNFTSEGTYYYVCGVGDHCHLGQVLTVVVSTTATPMGPMGPMGPSSGPQEGSGSGLTPHVATVLVAVAGMVLGLFM